MPPVIKNRSELLGGSSHVPPDEIVFGRSPEMSVVHKRVEKICHTNVPVLLCGDPGTGKETAARWMHFRSPYKEGKFVKVNCAAIPGALLESELFGYEKGAFTGAHALKPGRVEVADKGTLFLDEIADLDMGLQSKLLHFVQDGTFSRIGGESEKFVEARIICSTNRDLEREIEAGRFRPDLYYRISVFQIRLPRLSERREDVPALAQYFRALYQRQFAKECDPLGAEMLNYLENLPWPGNVRELSNCIARYVLIGQDAFAVQDFPNKRAISSSADSATAPGLPLRSIAKEAIRELERNVILEALRTNQWNRRKTAEALKISYRALIYKIRDAGLVSRRGGLVRPHSEPLSLPGTSPAD
ncbi:MAG TPA: sigma-54 dependent transcriptional regulator [Candidatus Acidoferrum sp.]|nr:sigma-54 dependent transcriptional regulator [Candidatus Acidoferrum sp.]